MGLYKKRPITVEAEQLIEGKTWPAGVDIDDANQMYVTTIQGQKVAIRYGEWVIAEGDGLHFYPCADEVFRRTYEPENATPPRLSITHRELKEIKHALFYNAACGNGTTGHNQLVLIAKMASFIGFEYAVDPKEPVFAPMQVSIEG